MNKMKVEIDCPQCGDKVDITTQFESDAINSQCRAKCLNCLAELQVGFGFQKPQHKTAPTPGEWKLIDMPDTWDIASQENRNSFGVFARIDKNEIYPGQARANALCMVKAKVAIKLLRQLREGYTPLALQPEIDALQPEIDALLEDFKKEGIFI